MSVDSNGKKESPEVNDVAVGESRDIFLRDELKGNRIDGEIDDGREELKQDLVALQLQLQVQEQQPPPQGSMVCWEKFLHVRTLKVLLVENDDCTRHVVSALLRNCSYEVMDAANGLQAWRILEDLTNHIDLVLTEVVLPSLSGIGLLCKITSHKTRKNIPVIMTSSHDSMGLVFKCLSRGAVDFLVKPIRKNELKNLWQHVWRRCHSSSGSGSESGTQTQKSVKSRSVEKTGNNSGSNDEDDNGGIGLNVGDGSDDGSGTQSSWTKQAVEVESPRLMSPWGQRAECPDSTCARVIHSNAETSVDKWMPRNVARKCEEHEELETVMGKDLEIGVPRNLELRLEHPKETPIQLVGPKQNNLAEIGSKKFSELIDKGDLDLNGETSSSRLNYKANNLTGIITNNTDPQVDGTEIEASNKVCKILGSYDKANKDTKKQHSLELSLKRLRGVKDNGIAVQDDRNVLRQSGSSAFSRYNTASNATKASTGKIRVGSPLNNSLEFMKNERLHSIQSSSNCNPHNPSSNEGSNNIDMGSTTDNAFTKPVILENKSAAITVQNLKPSSLLHPIKNDFLCAAEQVGVDKGDDVATMATLAQPRGPQVDLQVWHLHHHYDRHFVHHVQQQKPPFYNDDLPLKKMAAAAPQCGSSNVLGEFVEGITTNCSLNRSASGSNHGSSRVNGSSAAMQTGGTNMESDNGLAGKSGSGDASGSGSGDRVDQNKSAQREAALTKFRQKRKERCFRNKVRYQSRKKLAEQRPRVQGQFVRQTAQEDRSRTTDSIS